jgi:adenosine deaminase
VKLLQVRYAPTNYRSSHLKLYQIVESVLDGIERAKSDFGIQVGLIICGLKHDKKATDEAVRLAVEYKRSGVVEFDMAEPEHGYPPKDFESALMSIFTHFIPITIPAGEGYGAKSIGEAES